MHCFRGTMLRTPGLTVVIRNSRIFHVYCAPTISISSARSHFIDEHWQNFSIPLKPDLTLVLIVFNRISRHQFYVSFLLFFTQNNWNIKVKVSRHYKEEYSRCLYAAICFTVSSIMCPLYRANVLFVEMPNGDSWFFRKTSGGSAVDSFNIASKISGP